MKFACDECGTRYAIADEKVAGKTVRIRCKKCRSAIVVKGPAATAAPESLSARASSESEDVDDGPTRMVPASEVAGGPVPQEPAPSAAEWHAVIGGKQTGPLTLDALRDEARAGRLTARTYVWHEDMDGWLPAAEVEAVAAVLRPTESPDADRALRATRDAHARKGRNGAAKGAAQGAAASARAPRSGGRVARPLDEDAPGGAEATPGGAGAAPATGLEDLFSAPPEPKPRTSKGRPPAASAAGPSQSAPEPDDPFAATDGAQDPFAKALASAAASDPFAAFDDSDVQAPPPHETTQMFIIASGVNKQKSPWRIAAAVGGFVAVLGGLVFVAQLGGVDLAGLMPARTERTKEASSEWVAGDSERAQRLRDQLLGIKRDEPKQGRAPGARLGGSAAAAGPAQVDGDEPQKEAAITADLTDPQRSALADLYAADDRGQVAIKVRQTQEGPDVDSTRSPIDPAVIQKKMTASQRAFQTCVQQELRRNPGFPGGKVILTLTVTPSGIVRDAQISDRAIDQAEVGECIKRTTKRIMLPSFAGTEPVDFELPLVLSKGF